MALIAERWDEMLRLAASLKYRHITASLIVNRLSAATAEHLAAPQKEYGALRKTIYAARYLYRESTAARFRQLNKDDNLGDLAR